MLCRATVSEETAKRLDEYERRRTFESTPEPGTAPDAAAPGSGNRFTIQEHSATRLHWDLRLERDGVLLSWALPRGLPHDPETNRLAVHTEDHPLSYLDFEGTIPPGNYGAGTMRIVDRGTYTLERGDEGKLVVELAGERLGGRFALFQTDGRNWMVHRMDAPEPGWHPLPSQLVPMLARIADQPPAEPGAWANTIDWGGLRVLAFCDSGRLTLRDPEGRNITPRFPEVRDLLRQLGIRDALFDGELAVLDAGGHPDPERLGGRLNLGSEGAIRTRANREPATLLLGDLLHLDGTALMDRPFAERLGALEALELEGGGWRTASFHVGDAAPLLAAAEEQELDGILAKRLDSPYVPGDRAEAGGAGDHWLLLRTRLGRENPSRSRIGTTTNVVAGWTSASSA
jgi:bifunctional non-homologous end joining protein LigD